VDNSDSDEAGPEADDDFNDMEFERMMHAGEEEDRQRKEEEEACKTLKVKSEETGKEETSAASASSQIGEKSDLTSGEKELIDTIVLPTPTAAVALPSASSQQSEPSTGPFPFPLAVMDLTEGGKFEESLVDDSKKALVGIVQQMSTIKAGLLRVIRAQKSANPNSAVDEGLEKLLIRASLLVEMSTTMTDCDAQTLIFLHNAMQAAGNISTEQQYRTSASASSTEDPVALATALAAANSALEAASPRDVAVNKFMKEFGFGGLNALDAESETVLTRCAKVSGDRLCTIFGS
jgi:hypothetical protein